MTLIELVIAMAMLAALVGLAIPTYSRYQERARRTQVLADISGIQTTVKGFEAEFRRYPNSLIDVGMDDVLDPWNNPYQYLNIGSGPPSAKGKARKDKNLVPINSDYDLYSRGPDGDSKPPLTAKASHDDIIRANDGGFVGVARDY